MAFINLVNFLFLFLKFNVIKHLIRIRHIYTSYGFFHSFSLLVLFRTH
jgi:hypothetical protein